MAIALTVNKITCQNDGRSNAHDGWRSGWIGSHLIHLCGCCALDARVNIPETSLMFHTEIPRRKSRQIMVGNVVVGSDAPISVQTMTNTETCNVDATVAQIERVAKVGADIVRVLVPTMEAAEAFGEIRKRSPVPLVADFTLITKSPCGWLNWARIACASIPATSGAIIYQWAGKT